MSGLAVRLIGFFVVFVCAAFPALGQLETRSSTTVLYDPDLPAAGDFNHDGHQDVALVCDQALCGGGVQVLLGNGDGTFQPGVSYQAGDSPESGIAVGDFNRDGNSDIVVTDYLGYTVSVLLGNGDGTFQPALSSASETAGTEVQIGDFNGDHVLDVAMIAGLCPGPCVSVLLGNGDGTFQAPMNTLTTEYLDALAVGDFNRDGNLDIVWTSGISANLNVLLGNGDGTFQAGATYSLSGGSEVGGVAAGDLNHDGILDLAVGAGLSIDAFLGVGDGTFKALPPQSIAEGGESMHVADMNQDGTPDLVFVGGNGGNGLAAVSIMLGKGNGTFGQQTTFPSGIDGFGIAVTDFNGDRQPDIAVTAELNNALVTLLNTGVVSFSPSTAPNFPEQIIGKTSPPQTVKVTNKGTTALSISAMKVKGQFAAASTCGASVAAGASCAITVTFTPLSIGNKVGTVSISDSASSKVQVIELTGAGTVVGLSPSKLNFGTRKRGSHTTLPVQMTNEGTFPLNITSISTGNNVYTQTNNCGTQLAVGASCTINVTFSPMSKGALDGTLDVYDNGGGSPQPVTLTGAGS